LAILEKWLEIGQWPAVILYSTLYSHAPCPEVAKITETPNLNGYYSMGMVMFSHKLYFECNK